MTDLFPAEFLAAVGRLRLDARPAPAGASAGAHRSPSAGQSLDFRDYRPYAAGDDLRRVDWNVYRRSGHLFLRRFDHPAVTPVEVVVDVSPSMFVESPTRYATAARVGAAVCAAALGSGDPLRLQLGGQTVRARGARRSLPQLLSALQEQAVANERGFVSTLRGGLSVIVSDFFHPDGIEATLRHLEPMTNRLVLVQVTQPWDADPSLVDEADLVDCESHATRVVAPTRKALAAYHAAYRQFSDALTGFAARRGARHVRIDASADTVGELASLFPQGVLRVTGSAS